MIGTTRCDIDYSAKYAAMEDQFINIATKDKDFTYKLSGAEKVCLDSYMAARNNKLLFSKGNFDVMVRLPFLMKLVVLLSLLRVREFAPMLSNEHGNKLFNSGKAEMPILSEAK